MFDWFLERVVENESCKLFLQLFLLLSTVHHFKLLDHSTSYPSFQMPLADFSFSLDFKVLSRFNFYLE